MDKHQRLLDGFFELVTIDCPTGKEDEVAALLKEKLLSLGFEVSEDSAGEAIGGKANNLFGFLASPLENPEQYPTVLLSAHMDCVNPCEGIEPQLIDGIITSKGNTILGGDDKSGVIAIIEGIRRLQEEKLPFCNVQIVFTVAEEGGVNGSKHMDQSKIKADFGYVFDTEADPGRIVYTAPGVTRMKIRVHGKASHAGAAPEKGINAIVAAAKAIVLLPQGRIDEETTANVGTINGGVATNIVPDFVEISYEVRSRNAELLAKITQDVVNTIENTAKEYSATAEVEVNKNYGAFKLDTNSKVIEIAKNAAEKIGLPVILETSGGGSDANNFNNYNVPTVPLATGMMDVHTANEYIKAEHLEQSCQWVMAILQEATKMPTGG